MGTVETELILKYGIPLAFKLWNDGKDEPETVKAIVAAVAGFRESDMTDALLKADEKQTKGIIDGLFGIITGATDAIGGLVKGIFGLFKNPNGD